MEAQVNNMKQQIEQLQVGDSIIIPCKDKIEKQRIRNYCTAINGVFRTRTTPEGFKVTKVSEMNKETLSNELRAMSTGEEKYIERPIAIVSGTIASIDGDYEVSTVTKVRRLG